MYKAIKYSIVPEIINSKKILFRDEKSVLVEIAPRSLFRFIPVFEKPFIVIDTFAEKNVQIMDIRSIDIIELSRLGYCIYSVPIKKLRWFKNQTVMYILGKKDSPYHNSRKLTSVPSYHKIQKDLNNNRIRIVGANAGYPHYESEGGCGKWIELN